VIYAYFSKNINEAYINVKTGSIPLKLLNDNIQFLTPSFNKSGKEIPLEMRPFIINAICL
jgi:hypothetical protein